MRNVLFSFLMLFTGISMVQAQLAEKGVIHIKDATVLNKTALNISGEWQFCFGKQLTAGEMRDIRPDEKRYATIPSNWIKDSENRKGYPAFGTATYYVRIIIDSTAKKTHPSYGCYVEDVNTAYSLWANDRLIMQAGSATPGKEGFQPMYFPQAGSFCLETDTLDLVLHVSNFFSYGYSGVLRDVLFGETTLIEKLSQSKTAISVIFLTLLFTLFVFQLTLSFTRFSEHSHAMLALLSFLFFYTSLLDGDFTIFHLLPDFSYTFGYRLWMFGLMAVPILFKLIRISYPNEMNKTLYRVVNILYLIVFIALLTLDLQLLQKYIDYVVLLSGICALYLLVVLIKAVRKGRSNSIIHIISFSIMVLLLINDLIYVTNPSTTDLLSQAGVCQYLLIQSMSLAMSYSKSHNLAVRLSEELEAANTSLESTVKERTDELQQTNTKLLKLNKERNFILSTISHDLMNSFNILNSFSTMLFEDKDLGQKERDEMIKGLHDTSEKAHKTLENILGWGKIQLSAEKEADLIQELSSMVKEITWSYSDRIKAKELRVTVDINNELKFYCHDSQLKTILRNLFTNAVKFSHTKGTITIKNHSEDGFVKISIKDDGVGMPETIQTSVFDFTIDKRRSGTTGEQGTGLGLIIVKELVENNHGTITCSSKPGEGTEFVVSFPVWLG